MNPQVKTSLANRQPRSSSALLIAGRFGRLPRIALSYTKAEIGKQPRYSAHINS